MDTQTSYINLGNTRETAEYMQATCIDLIEHARSVDSISARARMFAISVQRACDDCMDTDTLHKSLSNLFNAFDVTYNRVMNSSQWETFRSQLLAESKECGYVINAYAKRPSKKNPVIALGERFQPSSFKVIDYVKPATVTSVPRNNGNTSNTGNTDTQGNTGNSPLQNQHLGEPVSINKRLQDILQTGATFEQLLVTLLGMREREAVIPIMFKQGYADIVGRVETAVKADTKAAKAAKAKAAKAAKVEKDKAASLERARVAQTTARAAENK